MDEKEWLDTLPEDERLKVIAEHNKTIAQLKQPIDRVQDDAPDRWSRLQATADRRLELLREMEEFVWDDEQSAYFCQICGANSNHGHLDDCRLAKELGDE